jgi:hypothetical protein
MKSIIAILSALTLSILLIACGSDSSGPSEPGDWLPLAVGNWWQYELDGFWLTMYGDTVDWSGTFDREVTALCEHSGDFQVYEFSTVMHSFQSTPDTTVEQWDTMYIYLRETEEELRGYDDTLTTDYELIAQYPLTVGDSWNAYSDPDSTIMYEVTSLSATASVPAGSYSSCAVLRETDSTLPLYSWDTYLHRGVGIVFEVINSGVLEYAEISLSAFNVN